MKILTHAFTAGLTCVVLTACISIGGGDSKDKTPTSIYTLHPKDATATAGKGAATVVIPKPELPPGLAGTQRIALTFGAGAQMDYYADARWSAGLDDLVQAVLIQAARRGLKGTVVNTPELGTAARYKLAAKITDFQPVYKDAPDTIPTLTVGMTVTVTRQPTGAAQTQFSVKKTAPAAANTLTEVTKGLEMLLQAAADEAIQKAAPALQAK
jgi:ABC-type uncharacterized transport system auxiliary subunit